MEKRRFAYNYLILIFGLIAIAAFGYLKFNYVVERLETEQINSLKNLSQNVEHRLTENELLLDVLGSRLIENQLYLNQQSSHELLKTLLETKPALAGAALLDINGDYKAVSSNINTDNIPNVLNHPATHDDFLKTLQSESMVIGRNYYYQPLKSWVITFRKALRHQGQVVAVMATGIKTQNIEDIISTSLTDGAVFRVIKGDTFYRVVASDDTEKGYEQVYGTPINADRIITVSNIFKAKYGYELDQIKNKLPNTALNILTTDGSEEAVMATIMYLPKYNIWTIQFSPMKKIYETFVLEFASYLPFFILLIAALIFFLNKLSKKDSELFSLLQHQAEHDSLTKLPNRNYLENYFNKLKNNTPADNEISLLFIDLDNFKNINDTFGHYIGDKLLIQVAQRLTRFFNYEDKVIRFGGDEFIVLLDNNEHHDCDIAKQITQTIAVNYLIDDINFTIGSSIGIARERLSRASLNQLLSQADMAMFEAKKRKNWIEVFSENLQIRSNKATEVEHHLRSAVINKEIYLNYQPQLNKNGELYGVECLARWNSNALGFVPPNEFIQIAEDIGIMPELGNYLTKRAMRQMSQLQSQLNQRFHVSLNISMKQFIQEHFFDDFIYCVEESGIPFEYITIEVTESLFIEDVDSVLNTLEQFRNKGISISLDDFGTGFSSLNLLRKLPIHELKIDKSFVDDILKDRKSAVLIENIIDIAHEMGMYTLAEGVETKQQMDKLGEFNCDLYQGYLFSRPLSLIELTNFTQKTTILNNQNS